MREIKFRAWNGEKFQYFGIGTFWHNTDISVYHGLVLDGVKFEQFTGLHDNNGKEIYEGDIVKWCVNSAVYISPIIYDEFQACFWMDKIYNDWMRGEFEIIGNIHENQ